MNMKNFHLVAVAALLAALGAVGVITARAADPAPPASTTTKPALTVSLTQPQRSEMPLAIGANGSIAAWQEAIVGAESNGWRLSEVRVGIGDVVRRGQVLATFAADTAGRPGADPRRGGRSRGQCCRSGRQRPARP
jgi:HlyD family secretion protein